VEYQVQGQTFWDNNGAANYLLAEFIENVAALDARSPIEWLGGVGPRAPKSLYAFMRQ
jgi:hypothetical protein